LLHVFKAFREDVDAADYPEAPFKLALRWALNAARRLTSTEGDNLSVSSVFPGPLSAVKDCNQL
jgi:hypothetical protein